jgi:hypothetical protein
MEDEVEELSGTVNLQKPLGIWFDKDLVVTGVDFDGQGIETGIEVGCHVLTLNSVQVTDAQQFAKVLEISIKRGISECEITFTESKGRNKRADAKQPVRTRAISVAQSQNTVMFNE